ncbi:hypothetical protein [Microcoleus vaginatus]|uniref:hypothetical protein n=1 Tax=Microcoleus vaginatus TaxID=119532 RepID=UPI00403F2D47
MLVCATPTPTGIAVEFPAAEPCGEVVGDGEVPGDTVVDVWGVFVWLQAISSEAQVTNKALGPGAGFFMSGRSNIYI